MDANQEGRVTSKIRGRGREWGFKDAGLDRGRDESKGRREEGRREEGRREGGWGWCSCSNKSRTGRRWRDTTVSETVLAVEAATCRRRVINPLINSCSIIIPHSL